MNPTSPVGIINLNKPQYHSSRQAVNAVQDLSNPTKVGHAGTLDPLATGVLVVCVGAATKLVQYLHDHPKEYIVKFLLGTRSTTDDVTGELTESPDLPPVDRQHIEELLPRFIGQIEQVPPLYSAVHVNGERAYKMARKGKSFAIAPRTVQVNHFEIVKYHFPELVMRIECGSGTYIRSIGRDLGELLGCGAVMSELTRTRVGPYLLEDAVTLDNLSSETWENYLNPLATAVSHLPTISCTAEECANILHGVPVAVPANAICEPDTPIALLTEQNQLACLAEFKAEERYLQPRKVFLK